MYRTLALPVKNGMVTPGFDLNLKITKGLIKAAQSHSLSVQIMVTLIRKVGIIQKLIKELVQQNTKKNIVKKFISVKN